MAISKRRITLMAISLFAFVGLSQIVLESFVDARAGGGRSGGFRGSRSYQSPSNPSKPNPSQPRRDAAPPPQQPSPFGSQSGGFMRTFGTAMLGGFLGSMLFSGLAHGGALVALAALVAAASDLLRSFYSPAWDIFSTASLLDPRPPRVTGQCSIRIPDIKSPVTPAVEEAPASNNDIDYRSLTMMDRSFDPNQFLKTAQDTFFKVQGAWNKQDTAALRSLCGSELMQTWEQELNDLRARGHQNKMENIALRESEITEAWTENGQDFITVRLHANLLDYTVDQKNGNVVSGNNSDPIEFQEYWTFTRPVGPNPWKLTAVQQA